MEVGYPGTWGLELLTQTQVARTPKSLLYPQPSREPRPPKPSASPGTSHIEMEQQWRTYWVDNEQDHERKRKPGGGSGGGRGDPRKAKLHETPRTLSIVNHRPHETTDDAVIARTPLSHAHNSKATPGHATTQQAYQQATPYAHKRQGYGKH